MHSVVSNSAGFWQFHVGILFKTGLSIHFYTQLMFLCFLYSETHIPTHTNWLAGSKLIYSTTNTAHEVKLFTFLALLKWICSVFKSTSQVYLLLPFCTFSGVAQCSWWTFWPWSAASWWASPPSAPPMRWWSLDAWSSACSAAFSPAWHPCTWERCRPLPCEERSALSTSLAWWWASWLHRSAVGVTRHQTSCITCPS